MDDTFCTRHTWTTGLIGGPALLFHVLNARRLRLLGPLLMVVALAAARPAHADEPAWLDARQAPIEVSTSAPGPWQDRTAEALAAWQLDALPSWAVAAAKQGTAAQDASEQGI